eukprot:scaffold498309_cov34-Prasinocladus_malaysianus.AAC.1
MAYTMYPLGGNTHGGPAVIRHEPKRVSAFMHGSVEQTAPHLSAAAVAARRRKEKILARASDRLARVTGDPISTAPEGNTLSPSRNENDSEAVPHHKHTPGDSAPNDPVEALATPKASPPCDIHGKGTELRIVREVSNKR